MTRIMPAIKEIFFRFDMMRKKATTEIQGLIIFYTSIFAPSISTKAASHLGWAGQAGDVTSLAF